MRGVQVFVKREDLYGIPPAPPLGKLRGLRVVLRRMSAERVRLVGCWDTRVSRLGHGLAAVCKEYPHMRSLVSYPEKRGADVPVSIREAGALGAIVLPLRGNHVSICYSQARKHVEKMGGRMLPFGMDCLEAVDAIAQEARRTPPEISTGTVVLSAGSGVTLAGLLMGLPNRPRKIIAISSGRSIGKIVSCLRKYLPSLPAYVSLREPILPYDVESRADCPFPAHPNYDLKAWDYLSKNVRRLKQPVLFWNIGA